MSINYINYYQLLGVETNASKEEIEKAWKNKLKGVHPDKNGGNQASEELTLYVNQAKDVLTDPVKRLEYDFVLGVKKRPTQNNNRPPESGSSGGKTLVAVGILGLLVGLAIGGSGNGSKKS